MIGGPPGMGGLNNIVIGGPGSQPQHNLPWVAPTDVDEWLDGLRPAEPSAVDRLAALVDEEARERVRQMDEAIRHWEMIEEVTEQTKQTQKVLDQVERFNRYADYEQMDLFPLMQGGGYSDYAPHYVYGSNGTGG